MKRLKSGVVLTVLLGALTASATERPPVTIAIPGLLAPTVDEETRELWHQQLAAALEGQGFTVLDAHALSARDIAVPAEGCHLPLPPLCGAGPGVDHVIVGSVIPTGEDTAQRVHLEMVEAGDRRSLWAGGFTAATEAAVTEGLLLIAAEHLPSASRRARLVDDRPRFLGLTQHQWGGGIMLLGTAAAAGSVVLFSEADRKAHRLMGTGSDPLQPMYLRDALRMRDAYRRELVGGVVLGAAGVGLIAGGLLTWMNAPAKPVSVQVVPSHNAGMLVFSGVLP